MLEGAKVKNSLFYARFVKILPYLKSTVFSKKRQTFVIISLLYNAIQKYFENNKFWGTCCCSWIGQLSKTVESLFAFCEHAK